MKIASCLAFDLFEGDFGDVGDREFSNKMVVARKDHPHCHICNGPIAKGELHRVQVMAFACDGVQTYRVCNACCQAAAKYEETGDYEELDVRYAIYLR